MTYRGDRRKPPSVRRKTGDEDRDMGSPGNTWVTPYEVEDECTDTERETTPDVLEMMSGRER